MSKEQQLRAIKKISSFIVQQIIRFCQAEPYQHGRQIVLQSLATVAVEIMIAPLADDDDAEELGQEMWEDLNAVLRKHWNKMAPRFPDTFDREPEVRHGSIDRLRPSDN